MHDTSESQAKRSGCSSFLRGAFDGFSLCSTRPSRPHSYCPPTSPRLAFALARTCGFLSGIPAKAFWCYNWCSDEKGLGKQLERLPHPR